jgi:hypothetical protein
MQLTRIQPHLIILFMLISADVFAQKTKRGMAFRKQRRT